MSNDQKRDELVRELVEVLEALIDAVVREGLDRTEAETNGCREETSADNFIKLMDALNASRSEIAKANAILAGGETRS